MAKSTNLQKFPSVNLSCEEIRNMYNYEQNRFQSIESKSTSLLTLNSILFTLLSVVSVAGNIIFVPTIVLLGISIYSSFKIFDLKQGNRPHTKYHNFYKYAKLSNAKVYDRFLLNYIKAIKTEEKINENKTKWLELLILYSKLSWVSFILTITIIILRHVTKTFVFYF